jgi:hypothetical protein
MHVMTDNTTLAHRRPTYHFVALLCALGFCASCGDEPEETPTASGAFQALAVQLQNCSSNALDCLGAANCDATQEQACRDQFRACREETRDAYRAFFEAARQCWADKRECLAAARDAGEADASDTGDAGANACAECRAAFRGCLDDNRPIRPEPGPCMQALRECVQADAQSGGVDDAAVDGGESRWSRHRARHRQVRDCLSQAHECIQNRLPMCGPDEPEPQDAGAAQDAS